MFGWLRLVLAFCVALAHAGLAGPGGLHIGVPAVVGFYLISGYVVAAQWRMLRAAPGGLGRFYLDRGLRVLPLYFTILAAAAAFLAGTGHTTVFASRPWDATCWWGNLLVLPLNSFPYTGVDRCTYVPPAWSLGLEMQFYLLAPLLFRHPSWRNGALWLSLGVFAAAALGHLPTEIYGYRLLPGTLFMFLAGGVLGDAKPLRHAAMIWAAVAVIGLAAAWQGLSSLPFNRETLLGFLLGYPLVALLAQRRRRGWDDWMAGISYPVFLSHFLLIWLFERYAGSAPASSLLLTAVYCACLTVLSALLWHACDEPMALLRRRLRKK